MNNIQLYEHQAKALDLTKDLNRVAYYLDMGLGKTFCCSEKIKDLNEKVNLVICQKSKINDWVDHFNKYYDFKVLDLTKKKDYENFLKDDDTYKVGVINYDLVWRKNELSKLKNFTLALDESSLIKNSSAKRTKFISKLQFQNVVLLSGTPVSGKYEELYSQIRLLGWNITKTAYWNTYIDYVNLDYGGFPIKKVIGYKNVDRLKAKLREHGAVFMKTEEVIELPSQSFILINIPTTKHYKKFKKDKVVITEDRELVGDTSLTQLLYLRQLCGQYNPYKLAALKDLLESTDDRIVIFYNFKAECEIIKDLCTKLGKPTSYINGDLRDLDAYENEYNAVTLVQYQAGALGVNLQKSNKIVYYTLPLSSDLYEQSKKRTHRINQDRTCFYYLLICEKSIEVKIKETLDKRKDFTDELFKECD